MRQEIDIDLVIPDPSAPALTSVQPWYSSPNSKYFSQLIAGLGATMGFDPQTPYNQLPEEAQHALIHGSDDVVNRPLQKPVWAGAELVGPIRRRTGVHEPED